MLGNSVEILSNVSAQSDYYERYSQLVQELCQYLYATEGVKAKAFPSVEEEQEIRQTFAGYTLEMQQAKFENFLQFYNHCYEISAKGLSLRDKKVSLDGFLYLYGLTIPSKDEIFSLMGENTYIEVYDLNFTQKYRSPDWLETTSYSLMTLETMDWRNLFHRSEHILKKQMEVVMGLASQELNQPIYRPIEIHTVKEIRSKSPMCAELESLAYCPVYDRNQNYAGLLHILRVNNLRTIALSVVKEAPSPEL